MEAGVIPTLTQACILVLPHIPPHNSEGAMASELSKLTGLSALRIAGLIKSRLQYQYVEVLKVPREGNKTTNRYRLMSHITPKFIEDVQKW